jgi:hypothetical protein
VLPDSGKSFLNETLVVVLAFINAQLLGCRQSPSRMSLGASGLLIAGAEIPSGQFQLKDRQCLETLINPLPTVSLRLLQQGSPDTHSGFLLVLNYVRKKENVKFM